MKNRLFLAFSISVLLLTIIAVNGCKDTASDPTYVELAEIRFADYHQVEPIQIYMYPASGAPDTISKTGTPLTYGLVTPYFNGLSTNREAGMTYHLEARLAGTKTVLAFTDVTLKPGDKKTWLISGNEGAGNVDQTLITDNPPANQTTSLAYFRFMNVTPSDIEPDGLNLVVGDPLSGVQLATGQQYKTVSEYKGIPVNVDAVFYVISNRTKEVLGRLAGVGLDSGSYHTITWGGAIKRIKDPTTGNFTLNDTVRIRILDDDPGTDVTLTPPLTFRFNIINALIPPNFPGGPFIDYTATGGLAVIINNNTVYDYRDVMPFSVLPKELRVTDEVLESIPTSIPLVEKIYVKFVKPGGKNPSPLDTTLFRFYAGNGNPFKSDELYTIVVFDTVKKVDPKAANNTVTGYDSVGGMFTVPIPDVPDRPELGTARIVLGYMLATAYRNNTSNNKARFYVNDVLRTNKGIGNRAVGDVVKSVDTSIHVPVGQPVTLKASVGVAPAPVDDYTVTFTPEAGGIYEAFLVGQRGRPDGKYGPRFIVVRVNPKQ